MGNSVKIGRLEWIDYTKAFAIIFVIVGHTVSFGSEVRNLIFSFHMPLFYILTGYTIQKCNSLRDVAKVTYKDFRRLYLPVFYSMVVLVILERIAHHIPLSTSIREELQRIVWCAAVSHNGHPALGSLWFLIVLFWAKLFYRTIMRLFSEEHSGIIFLFCILLTYFVSKKVWLPQSLDIVPLAAFYIYVGKFLSRSDVSKARTSPYLILASFVFWIATWMNGIYVEIGTRSFPYLIISIFAAIAGSICVISLCGTLSYLPHNRICEGIKRVVRWIGTNTLLILCVHNLDGFILEHLGIYNPERKMILSVVVRIAVVLFVSWAASILLKHVRFDSVRAIVYNSCDKGSGK
ncbi:MAG TPA: hypothetical protein DDY90_09595 [Clostridiales bacterium]|nr:hypothetical protein [Clostridiales bacterium]